LRSRRPFQFHNTELNEQIRIGATYAFVVLAAIQEMAGNQDYWNLKPCLIVDDVGIVNVTRRMDELLKAEKL
jgi:hypothetical protein